MLLGGSYRSMLENIQCPVCRETFSEPVVLRCGHCYCGPDSGKNCWKATQSEETNPNHQEGVIQSRCSVCRQSFQTEEYQLRPLFGIRSFLKLFMDSQRRYPQCTRHDCKDDAPTFLWCHSCDQKVCWLCLEGDHKQHQMGSFRQYLHGKATEFEQNFLDSSENHLEEAIRQVGAEKIPGNDDSDCFMSGIEEVKSFRQNIDAAVNFEEIEKTIEHLQGQHTSSDGLPQKVFLIHLVFRGGTIIKCDDSDFITEDSDQNSYSVHLSIESRNSGSHDNLRLNSLHSTFRWSSSENSSRNNERPVTFSGDIKPLASREELQPFRKTFTVSGLGKTSLSTSCEVLSNSESDWLPCFYRKKTCKVRIAGDSIEEITCFVLLLKCSFKLSIDE